MEFVAGPKPAADPCEKKARIDPKALYGLTIEERVAAALAHEQPPQPVLDKWARGRWWYVNTLFVSFVAVGLAFVPSIVKWLQTGVWHMNPIYSFTNPFQRLVGAHLPSKQRTARTEVACRRACAHACMHACIARLVTCSLQRAGSARTSSPSAHVRSAGSTRSQLSSVTAATTTWPAPSLCAAARCVSARQPVVAAQNGL